MQKNSTVVDSRKKSGQDFHAIVLGKAGRRFRGLRGITDRNENHGPEVIRHIQYLLDLFLFERPDPAGPEALVMGRKKQVLNADGRILDAVEVRAPLLVTRGNAQVRASDDHERRACNEADVVLSQTSLRQFVPDRFVKDKIELPALKISGAGRPAKGLNEDIDRASRGSPCP